MTLQVVVAGLLLSLVLGTLLGVFSTTRSRALRAISRVYVEFYQNTRCPCRCSLCTWPVRSFCRP